MTWLNVITIDPNQSMILNLPDGSSASFYMGYFDGQKGWFYSLTYGTFALYNRRVVTGVNMLRGFRNLLPFGLSCTTKDGYEPIYQNDFSSGRASMYLLNTVDVELVEEMFIGAQI